MHSSHFLCGFCSFIPQVQCICFRSTSFSKPKDAKQDNSIYKQWPYNCNFKFLVASKWWPCAFQADIRPKWQLFFEAAFYPTQRPCAFQADICPNNYNNYWTSGIRCPPLQFEWHHSSSSLLCNNCNNNCDDDSSPRNNSCNCKSNTKQAWPMHSASHQYASQQCNIEKSLGSLPNWLSNYNDTKRT